MIDEGEKYAGENIEDVYDENEIKSFLDNEDIILKESTSLMRGYDEDLTIEKTSRCRSCGHEIDVDDKICQVCGEILERLSESAYA